LKNLKSFFVIYFEVIVWYNMSNWSHKCTTRIVKSNRLYTFLTSIICLLLNVFDTSLLLVISVMSTSHITRLKLQYYWKNSQPLYSYVDIDGLKISVKPYVADLRTFRHCHYFWISIPWCGQRCIGGDQQHGVCIRHQFVFGLHWSNGRHRVLWVLF